MVRMQNLLAISPFTDSIKSQHSRRTDIWKSNPKWRPTTSCGPSRRPWPPLSTASPYPDWKTGLDDMRSQMDTIDFDLAIIGAGAWSLPLAVHAKRLGKVGIHLGGPTQLMFGIRGGRWKTMADHSQCFNRAWIRPGPGQSRGLIHRSNVGVIGDG